MTLSLQKFDSTSNQGLSGAAYSSTFFSPAFPWQHFMLKHSSTLRTPSSSYIGLCEFQHYLLLSFMIIRIALIHLFDNINFDMGNLYFMGFTTILVCFGYHNKIPQIGWLQQRNDDICFLTVLEVGNQDRAAGRKGFS